MKFLVAVSACHAHGLDGRNASARNTCLLDTKNAGIDYRLFQGHGPHCNAEAHKVKDDVVLLPVKDDFHSLIEKTRAKIQWAVQRDYDYVFHCYADTYFRIERLLSSGFEKFDYMGKACDPNYGVKHFQSGAGVFLSNTLCRILCAELPDAMKKYPGAKDACYFYSPCEDVWTGAVVEQHPELKVKASSDMIDLFSPEQEGPRRGNTIMTCHLSPILPQYKPEYMIQKHQEWLR